MINERDICHSAIRIGLISSPITAKQCISVNLTDKASVYFPGKEKVAYFPAAIYFMRKAGKTDKQLVTDLLSAAFAGNKSVNYIVKQDAHKVKRIRALMKYSFDLCRLSGDIFITDDDHACALIRYPHKKKFSLRATWLDIRLLFQCIGIANVRKTLAREALLSKQHPHTPFLYIWFIGVEPGKQQRGLGSALLNEILIQSRQNNLPVYLETSAVENLPFYQKHGFTLYHTEQLSYPLYFFKKE